MEGLQRFVKNSGKGAPPGSPILFLTLLGPCCIIHQLQTWLLSNGNLIPFPSKKEAWRLHLGDGDSRGGTSVLSRGANLFSRGSGLPAKYDFSPLPQIKSQSPRPPGYQNRVPGPTSPPPRVWGLKASNSSSDSMTMDKSFCHFSEPQFPNQ